MTRGFVAGLAFLLWLVLPAQAEDLKITDFYGNYEGSASTAEGAGESYIENRGSSVEISPDQNGFRLRWTTLQVKEDENAASGTEASVKTAELSFKPSGSAGMWYATRNGASLAPDKPFSWARITGKTLVVTTIALQPNGAYDVTSYERTLTTKDKMDLRFTRFKNGDIARRVNAQLERVTN